MPRSLFMTGATGYAGGAILDVLVRSCPQLDFTLLVRTAEQGRVLASTYPGVAIVVGTLESRELLLAEAARADVVLHVANVDHEAGTMALLEGMKAKESPEKGVYVVLSGSACLVDVENLNPGLPAPRVWSDVDDAEDIWNLPPTRSHVAIERRVVQECGGVKTVILAPSQIFTNGIGVGKKDSYLNELPRAIMEYGKGFTIAKGENAWAWIGIEDLGEIVAFVVDQALKGDASRLGYGKEGYYFCQTGELTAAEEAEVVAQELKRLGAIETDEVVSITAEKAMELNSFGAFLWGTSLPGRADKLRKLGWEAKMEDWRPLVQRAARVEFENRARPG